MAEFREDLDRRAHDEGFSAVRVARIEDDPLLAEGPQSFIALGRHGDMDWLATTAERRESPRQLWPEARTAIVLAHDYGQDLVPLARIENRAAGVIATYALNRDYHEVVKGKLKRLAGWLARAAKAEVKVFIDTAPLMEKPLAARAGLGWQGKHTNLVSRQLGSWFFIGAILTSAEIAADEPEKDHCGACRACLDICPTKAFPAPYQLDARRCISYLTIEHQGHIAPEFRGPMGNRIYGCDDCLAVCPWNKFAALASEAKLVAREDLKSPPLADLLKLDDAGFRTLFAGSPVKRTGRDRFLRNVLIAAGNSGEPALLPDVERLLDDSSPLIRAMAVWALSKLMNRETFAARRAAHAMLETDPDVRREWEAA